MSDSSARATAPSAGEPQDTAPSRSRDRAWAEPVFEPVKTGMQALLLSEAVFFAALIISYARYIGESPVGPTPGEVLGLWLPIAMTIWLPASSATIVIAYRGLLRDRLAQFYALLGVTALLGLGFLAATAYEWRDLVHKGLWPSTNLFGSGFYTMVGFHALHIALGIILLFIMAAVVARGWVSSKNPVAFQVTTWFWHVMNGIWVVMFIVIYIISR